jgi:hypothetical protein
MVQGLRTVDKVTYVYDTYGNMSSQSQTVNGSVRSTQYIGFNNFAQPERVVSSQCCDSVYFNAYDGTLQSQFTGVGGTTGAITGQTHQP